jgi:hypothetical protein
LIVWHSLTFGLFLPNFFGRRRVQIVNGKNLTLVFAIALVLQFGMLAVSAQTREYQFTGSERTIILNPGTYDITAYGAQGGFYYYYDISGTGSLGAKVEAQFYFSNTVTLTFLVGGAGAGAYGAGGGGGGGSFVVNDSTPLLIAGGGGGGIWSNIGGEGMNTTSGSSGYGGGVPGVGGYGGSGAFGGGGGGGGFYSSGGGGTFGGGGGDSFYDGGSGGGGGGYSTFDGDGFGGDGGFGGGGGGEGGYNPGGGGGGGYSGGGGGRGFGGGGGGGSFIDSSAIVEFPEVSGIASPDGSPNGEIIILTIHPTRRPPDRGDPVRR